LRKNAEKNPDKVAIHFFGREISYGELNESSDRFANYLLHKGLIKGDRVGIFMANCPQYVIAHMGIQKMGGIVCPLNSMFKELEVKYEVNDAEISALITMDLYVPIINHIKDDCPTLQHIIFTNFHDYLPEEPTLPLFPYMKIPRQQVSGADDFL
jgi:long-chain acyl-CoA synthetase